MKARSLILITASTLALALSSCDTVGTNPSHEGEGQILVGKTTIPPDVSPAIEVNGFTVRFDGRTFDHESDVTTFGYTVAGPGEGHPAFNFQVELPDCAPDLVGTSPHAPVVFDSNTQIYGPLWDLHVPADGERSFLVALEGSVPLGIVNLALSVGEERASAEFLGPCDNIFDISGSVFSDANSNGARGQNESGLAEVTVVLNGPYGYVFTDVTNSDGVYHFEEQFKGNYLIEIVETPDDVDFNEELLDSFTYTGGAEPQLETTIGPDSEDNNFGLAPNTDELVNEIEQREVVSGSETFRFWRRELHKAANYLDQFERDRNDADDDATGKQRKQALINEMQSYVDAVEALLIAEPFQFESSNELRDAYEAVADNARTDIDRLRRELLVAELNFVSGRSISNRPGLGLALLGWGEGVVANNTPSTANSGKSHQGDDVTAALRLFSALNSSGGGGAVDD